MGEEGGEGRKKELTENKTKQNETDATLQLRLPTTTTDGKRPRLLGLERWIELLICQESKEEQNGGILGQRVKNEIGEGDGCEGRDEPKEQLEGSFVSGEGSITR